MLKKLLLSVFFISFIANSFVDQIHAETATWNFSTPADYTYDTAKIVVSGNQARLAATSSPAWYNDNWSFRRTITISQTNNLNELTNFQTELRLNSANFDFSKATANGSELRFTDTDGVTDLHYWIEEYNSASQSASIMLEVPSLQPNASKDVYLYYGNQAATSTSNWANTFTGAVPSNYSDIYGSGHELYNSFPAIVRASNGDLLVTFRSGSAHSSIDGKLMLARSTDNGATWSTSVVYDDPTIDDRVNTGLVKLANGHLLLPFFKFDGTNAQGAYVLKSTDNGTNWTLIPVQNSFQMAAYGKIVELSDGKLLLPTYTNAIPNRSSLWQSTDEGETWSFKADIAVKTTEDRTYNETSVLALSDSNLLAMIRGYGSASIYQTMSSDGGATWTTPVFLFDGVSPDLVKTSSGKILLCVGDRDVKVFGIRCHISDNNGQTWSKGTFIFHEMLNPRGNLGYPATIELSNGNFLTAYYYKNNQTGNVNVASVQYKVDGNTIYLKNDNSLNFFEGIESGNLNNWQTITPKNQATIVSSALKHSGTYSFSITDTSIGTAARGDLSLFTNPEPVGDVSFWVYPKLAPNGIQFGLLGDGTKNTDRLFWFSIEPDHSLKYYDGQTNTLQPLPNSTQLNFNVWTKINIRFNALSNTAEISVNGENKGSIAQWNPGEGVKYVEFSSGSIPATGDSFNIDDIYAHQYALSTMNNSSVNQVSKYPTDNPYIFPTTSALQKITSFLHFSDSTVKNGGEVKYQVSNDLGSHWYWFNTSWVPAENGNYQQANTSQEIDSQITSFPLGNGQFIFKAYLSSNGSQLVKLNTVNLEYSGWQYREQLTFNNQDSAEDLDNFPVLIKLTATNFNFAQAQTDGDDIRFFDEDDQTNLEYKIERWDKANNIAYIWVKISKINHNSAADRIYMYWGNSQAQDGQTTAGWEHSPAWMHALYKVVSGAFVTFPD